MREDSDRSVGKFEVDDETLADFGLVLHHAVAGMDDDAGDEDRIGHRLFPDCRRHAQRLHGFGDVMGADDPRAALRRHQMRRDRAAEPLMRLRRRHRADEALARCADQQRQAERLAIRRAAPARSCSARASCRSRCRDRARSCRGEMPALAAMSSERAKKAAMSCMMSMAGSALSRLCMMMTGTPRSATSPAMPGSRCRPQTSLAMAAP